LLTEKEKEIIGILLGHGIGPDAFGAPILAIDRAMKWSTKESRKFVDGLIDRKIVRPEASGRTGNKYGSNWKWQPGELFHQEMAET
jgi:hypothetical protein